MPPNEIRPPAGHRGAEEAPGDGLSSATLAPTAVREPYPHAAIFPMLTGSELVP